MTDDPRMTLITASRQALALGLNSGTVGNFSLRHGDGMVITPTGIPPGDMQPDHIVAVDFDGSWQGRWRPSSEWAIHARVYQTTPAQAIVHAHPDHCVALSCLRQPLPAFHYMIASFGGNLVPCAEYASFGSAELAETVGAALGTTFTACLMANHGIVTYGADMASAMGRAEKLEMLARQYLMTLSAGGPVLLTPEQMADVHARYGSYGQQPSGA